MIVHIPALVAECPCAVQRKSLLIAQSDTPRSISVASSKHDFEQAEWPRWLIGVCPDTDKGPGRCLKI